MTKKKTYCIGVMSGTSLDGLDIALCSFWEEDNKPKFEIIEAETVNYSNDWYFKLLYMHYFYAYQFSLLNNQYGQFIGKQVNSFIEKHRINKKDIAFIASHGHTVFHTPDKNITVQVGDGSAIYAETGIKTIYDFRQLDIYRGGQGAPLVPIGDHLLFSNYELCLNLGGFANISYASDNGRIAYDIVPVNIVLNGIAQSVGLKYDAEGEKASRGHTNEELLERLNLLEYYTKKPPKSLGREWVEQNINPLIEVNDINVKDMLRTYVEHICIQINNAVSKFPKGKILVTGGGTYNTFLINRLQELCKHELVIPEKNIIEYKEALIFAFLGYLKTTSRVNTLASVTGAICDSISGIVIEE